jgi:hypothetical protein
MASKRRGTAVARPKKASSLILALTAKTVRWVIVPCLGVSLLLWFATTFASLHSARSVASAENFVNISRPARQAGATTERPSWKEAAAALQKKQAASAAAKNEAKARAAKPGVAKPQPIAAQQAVVAAVDPFARALVKAGLSRDKLLAAFAGAGMAVSLDNEAPATAIAQAVEIAMPEAARFHRLEQAGEMAAASILDPSAPLALAPIGIAVDLAYASGDADANLLEVAIATLEISPPETDVTVALAEPAKPEAQKPAAAARPQRQQQAEQRAPRERGGSLFRSPRAAPDSRKPAASPDRQEALAYARPDKPDNAFKKLFNDTPKAGNKVAIYDISAAVVHMPDGTKMEAHSGIGKMADNPRYVNVKMNGPTPPNTYRLSMREKLFHGVEAIRMTPIGNQTMHGRDGILAHSYLLRGGREESHGCVAFANYPRFLKAFKQGKITHIIVVPSMSKLSKTHFASIGRGA